MIILQKKAAKIMNFKEQLFHSKPLFSTNNLLKFGSVTALENIPFVNKSTYIQVPPIFYDWCTFSEILNRNGTS